MAVLFLMLAAVVFAALTGALAFVTGPVGLGMAGVIAVWLVLYAARSFLRKHARQAAAGDATAGASASASASVAVAVRRG